MPVNTTVSHVSPLISYIPRSAWFEGSPSDPNLANYTYKSYHATNNTASGNASVVFSWWGTGVWVHGGYRRRLGEYTVTLDGNTTTYPGYVNGTDEDFQAMLFNATDLPAGPHHLRITNASDDPKRPVFDIDHILFESLLEKTQVVSHTSTDCTWSPVGNGVWTVDEQSHSTKDSLGTLELDFTSGSGFILYGQLDHTSAPLSITIDGQSSHSIMPNTAITPLVSAPQVLFAHTNLLQGNHTIRVENNPTNHNATAQQMDIMYGQVLSTHVEGTILPPSPEPASGTSHSHRNTVIFAASFGSLGLFFLTILIWRVALYIRRQARHKHDVQLPRPFYARADASPSASHPYQRAHRSQPSYAHATSRYAWRGHSRGNTSLMDEIDALQHSFSRMRRPPPVSVASPQAQARSHRPGPGHWYSTSKAAALEAEYDEDDHDHDELQFAPVESYSPRLQRHPTDATASSHTMYDSMSVNVNVPASPTSPDIWSPQSADSPATATLPLRVGRWTSRAGAGAGAGARRSSIEKPLRRHMHSGWPSQLGPVGSPIASTPSVASRALPLPPPPVAGLDSDQDVMPPPYRLLDMH